MQVIIAEKPSVGRQIAAALGVTGSQKTHIEDASKKIIVTWAIGHLVGLKEPDEVNPEWKKWEWEILPMDPEKIPLKAIRQSLDQWLTVKELLNRKDVTEVVCATDAGREGELIFARIYQLSGCKAPAKRLWTSSMTAQALREAYANLRPADDYRGLRQAARCRSEADWLIGMNGTRAMTLLCSHRFPGAWNVGRVITPTLALLTGREKEIADFKARDYWTLTATFNHAKGTYKGRWLQKGEGGTKDSFDTEQEAKTACDSLADAAAMIASAKDTKESAPPEQFFDISALQIEANKRFGHSPAHTLEIAQKLYEAQHISYPRTGARHLTKQDATKCPACLEALRGHPDYGAYAAEALASDRKLGDRFIDDAKVEDHSALTPTENVPAEPLGEEESKIYDLIARRFIAAFYPDMVQAKKEIITTAKGHRFRSTGTTVLEPGWQQVDKPHKDPEKAPEPTLPNITASDEGSEAQMTDPKIEKKQTKPPKRLTEGALIAAMRTAGRDLEDAGLKSAMKDSGLGTPATRAAIIERLLEKGTPAKPKEPLVRLEKKCLVPTQKGTILIDSIPTMTLKSPEMTARWEAKLDEIARGNYSPKAFMDEVRAYLNELVADLKAACAKNPPPNKPPAQAPAKMKEKCPRCRSDLTRKSWQGRHYIACTKANDEKCFFAYPTKPDGTPLHTCPRCKGRVNVTKQGKKICVDCNRWL